MKIQKLAAYAAVAAGALALAGCSRGRTAQLENELVFSLKNISEVTISYDEETVTFYETQDDELVIREYMTENRSRYYARVDQGNDHIRISEGGKPFFKDGFYRYIEICIPASYQEALTVTTTDGDIDLSGLEMSLGGLRIDSTAGAVRLGAVEAKSIYLSTTSGILDADSLCADTIRIATTSGGFSCERLDGKVTCTTTSGSMDIKAAYGSGSYRADNSGELNVVYAGVTGDLSFFNKNDSIHVTLPENLEFEFEATTKNGSVSTNFEESVSMEGRTTRGTVGGNPTVTVRVETNNGDIEVKR